MSYDQIHNLELCDSPFNSMEMDVKVDGATVGTIPRHEISMIGQRYFFQFHAIPQDNADFLPRILRESTQVGIGYHGHMPIVPTDVIDDADDSKVTVELEPDDEAMMRLAIMYFEARASIQLLQELVKSLDDPRFDALDLAEHSDQVFGDMLLQCELVCADVAPRTERELALFILLEDAVKRRRQQSAVGTMAESVRKLDIILFDAVFELCDCYLAETGAADDWALASQATDPGDGSALMMDALFGEKQKKESRQRQARKSESLQIDRSFDNHKHRKEKMMYINTSAFKAIFATLLTAFGVILLKLYDAAVKCNESSTTLSACYDWKLSLTIAITLGFVLLLCAYLAGWFGKNPKSLFELDSREG